MAKVFSVASWNIEHFKGDPSRVDRVVDFLALQKPDVFGLYEVEGARVFESISSRMPNYTFQITEGPQTQEILIGVKKNLTAFITQKTTFRSGTTHMRPGQLVTVTKNGTNYALLFLHIASGSNPRGMGLRDDMIERAIKFRKDLDKAEGGPGQAHYLFLGDLNTMGLKYPYQKSIEATTEIRKIDARAKRKGMMRLEKTHSNTWWNGSTGRYDPANLDHVYASDNLTFKMFNANDGSKVPVDVRGWVEESTITQQDDWISQYSDHALLYFEIHS